ALVTEKWSSISPMRPGCLDGVVIATGLLYWGPWICGCPLSLVGSISLAPAGDFNFSAKATEAERLESAKDAAKVAPLAVAAGDWPTYRKDNARSARSEAAVAKNAARLWRFESGAGNTPTPPVIAGGLVFVAGSDGTVRALDAKDGKERWKTYTGGAIKYPPTVADGRVLVGSGDGWIYALEAVSGRLLWRFRAAPLERKIAVHKTLLSTWPVASGVLVEEGVAYAAAGIANYDGTQVYALDAATGKIRWQNNTSGNTAGGQGRGVSVVGHLLFHNKTLYLASGNSGPVASYDEKGTHKNVGLPHQGLGKDLFLQEGGKRVIATGLFPLYSRPEDFHYIEEAELPGPAGTLRITPASRVVNWRYEVDRPQQGEQKEGNTLRMFKTGEARAKGAVHICRSRPFGETIGAAIAANAVLAAGTNRRFDTPDGPPVETHGIAALNIGDGKVLWSLPLPAGPVSWGVAIGPDGRVVVALQDGSIACFGKKD
ncbi:MAG: PQQ-like beta-propeller repeat protein, partial [Planctomycetia bacterium]|nr:PQQ-like beta-propeller repeat protein [Planctomycetia bacterium]